MGNRVETQDRLLAATRQIIINEGIEATSLEHICSVAGFTRGAFYSNFSSKDSLLGILAEAEYSDLIQRLRERVLLWENAQTPASRNDDGDRQLLMENLLFEALDAIHIDQGLYILHSEMLMRSIRDAEWGMRLLDLNREFADQLGSVLHTILTAAGRELTVPIGALTQSVIGVVMRAAGLAGWREAIRAYRSEHSTPTDSGYPAPAPRENHPPVPAAHTASQASPATRSILEVVLVLLYACSREAE